MKKAAAFLLVLAMLFACGCGGGSNESQKDDKYDAVKPGTGEDGLYITDSTWGTNFNMTHVDTESFGEDAKAMLDLAEGYLSGQGIGAKIKAMYSIAFGMAGNFDDVLVLKIFFTDESVQPIYLEVLHDFRKYSAGWSVMGSFRDSDVTNNEYFNKALSIADGYDEKLTSNIGFLRDDVTVCFPIRITRDLSFQLPDANDETLMGNTREVFNRFTLAGWSDVLDEPTTIDGIYVQRINDPKITSLASLDVYLGTAFTGRVVKEIKDSYDYLLSGTSPVYIEKDGSVYIQPIGMGGPMGLMDAYVKYVAQQGDREFVVIEAKRCDFDDDFNPINIHYTEHLFVFEKQGDGSLRCDYYDDYVFGRYTSSMETE
ncbi:MAG: hypothetical protein J5528_05655 [Firmicutes bacterium]|nr:hypothetical protein [Bacillota bacterium]